MDNSLQIVNTNREMQEWADKIRACRRGAQGSAIIYSLVETAKENRLDPFKYLVHVLSTAKK